MACRPLASFVCALAWLQATWLPACAHRFDGRVFHGDGFAFAVPSLPERWRRVAVKDDGLAFRDPESEGTVLLNARCGENEDDVPLAALTRHLFIDFTKRRVEAQQVLPFDGREAMHTMMSADLDGVPMRYDVWVMKKNGCVWDMVYFAPPTRFERGVVDFARVVQGFSTVQP